MLSFRPKKQTSKNVADIKFSIICLTETWENYSNINQNSLFQLEGYIPIHQIRKSHKGEGIVIFIRDSLLYKLRSDLKVTSATKLFFAIE